MPLLPGVRELAEAGHVPGGTRTNLELAAAYAEFGAGLDEVDRLLACDAQTSGGLLVALPARARGGARHGRSIGRLGGRAGRHRAGTLSGHGAPTSSRGSRCCSASRLVVLVLMHSGKDAGLSGMLNPGGSSYGGTRSWSAT